MAHLKAVNTLSCARRLVTAPAVLAGGGSLACNELSFFMDGWKLHISPLIRATTGEL